MAELKTVEIEWQHFTLKVSGEYEKGDKGLWTYPNGDPGYPPTSSGFYPEGIELIKGELLDFIQTIEHYAKKQIGFSIEEQIEDLVIQKIES